MEGANHYGSINIDQWSIGTDYGWIRSLNLLKGKGYSWKWVMGAMEALIYAMWLESLLYNGVLAPIMDGYVH